VANANALGSGSLTQSNGSSVLVINTTGTVTNQMNLFKLWSWQTVTLSGNKTLGNATYDITNNTTTTESGTLSGIGGITKLGTGTLVVTASNTFTGAVDVQAGLLNLNSATSSAAGGTTSVAVASGATLLISQNNQVNNTATVSLTGGTIRTAAGVSEVFGNLTVTGSGFLDFGATFGNASSMNFGTYTPSALLTINNFDYGSTLTFGSDLTSTINNSSFFTFNNGGIASSSWNGSTFTITAIPEPSTYLAAAGLLALCLWPLRRRLLPESKKAQSTPPLRGGQTLTHLIPQP
jgi:autotransporter-associated beta strand protein